MKHKKPLEPEDFPVQTENSKITKSDGETIADAKNDKMAEEICDRLNTDHAREEEEGARARLYGFSRTRPPEPRQPGSVSW